jgi:hypothetical protein
MRIIRTNSPSPRLLNTVARNVAPNKAERPAEGFSLKTASLFSGNGRAIFVGLVVGAAIFWILGVTYTRHQSHKRQKEADARATAILRPSLSATELAVPLTPALASQIRVTAISLGEPHVAIVNGKQVTEGENIVIPVSNQSTAVTLRVVKIADGRIDLTNGTQMITARLETLRSPNRNP